MVNCVISKIKPYLEVRLFCAKIQKLSKQGKTSLKFRHPLEHSILVNRTVLGYLAIYGLIKLEKL